MLDGTSREENKEIPSTKPPSKGWYGVDLDGTLAKYPGTYGVPHGIGEPIPRMVDRVKKWVKEGTEVRIVTARAAPPFVNENLQEITEDEALKEVYDWCQQHIGVKLPVTCKKDYSMIELWDDRAIQVIPNMGYTVSEWSNMDKDVTN